MFLGSTPIGGPIVGAISERFGARYGIAVGAAATLAASAFGLFTVRRSRRLVLAPEPGPMAIPVDGPGHVTVLDPLITPKAS